MKRTGLQPAQIAFGDTPDSPPRATAYGDIYHPRIGALAQARHVFLQGNALPARWAGRRHFTVLETGFGLGNNFLATWQAWRSDPQRCQHLHFVAVELHPPCLADLARAQAQSSSQAADLAAQLLQAWPVLTTGLHALDFEEGRVQLLLAFGDANELLPRLRLHADAVFLDGFAPAHNPDMWQPRLLKAVGRLAAPGATLATWSVATDMRAGLATAGFDTCLAPGTGGKREITLARFAPRFAPRPLPTAAVPDATHAVVVGAGLAGAAAARALARLGLQVTVLEQHGAPAQQASGNPGGLFHGTLNPDDGVYARLFRAAALQAQREFGPVIAAGKVPGQAAGLLRLETALADAAAMQTVLGRLGLPADYVGVLSRQEASNRTGVPLPGPAWFYPGGGWVCPALWVRHALATPGVQLHCGAAAHTLLRLGSAWCVQDAAGQTLGHAPIVVLANAEGAAPLLAPLGHGAWPLMRTRGQVTHWSQAGAPALALPVAGDGYALPLPGGLLCGATRQDGDEDPTVRDADHRINLARLQRLTGLSAPAESALWQGRVGWRLQADDRLPIAGAMPLAQMPAGQRLDQVRLLPREQGLFVLTALGARGLTLAPLLARLVAAQATGTPWPVEQALADAVDPARWRVRMARVQPGG